MSANTDTSPVRGHAVKAKRKAKKLTQQQLADLATISAPTVQRIERSDPTVTRPMMVQVANALGADLTELYDDPVEVARAEASPIEPPAWFTQYVEQQQAQLNDIHMLLKRIARKTGA